MLTGSAGQSDEHSGPSINRKVRLHHFAMLSGIGWLIDFSIFNLLVYLGFSLFVANVFGATCGVSFVFITGRHYIFRDIRTGLAMAILAYAAWNIVAIAAMSWAIAGLGKILTVAFVPLLSCCNHFDANTATLLRALVPPVAKIALTPVSMYANFVAMGLIVERRLHFL